MALISGVTGIASSFSWIEPLRPYLIGITLVVLGFAWYQKLKPKKEIECDCDVDEKSSFLQSKLFLGIVTIFAFLMLAFPYYSENFFPNRSKKILIVDEPSSNDSIMTIKAGNIAIIHIDIEGMTCTSCNYTVQNASLSVPGVFEAKADYKTAKATIKFDKSLIKEAIMQHHLSTWEEITSHYRKKVIEKCEHLNPTGYCCRNTFDKVVAKLKQEN